MRVMSRKSEKMAAAERIAAMLLEIKQVEDVFLFGSLAELGDGGDIDLIVIVPKVFVNEYYNLVAYEKKASGELKSRTRLRIFGDLFQVPYQTWRKVRASPSLPEDVDVLVMPPDWQNRFKELSVLLLHEEPNYLDTVWNQAKTFNPTTKCFQ